jgi:hypothetical protein
MVTNPRSTLNEQPDLTLVSNEPPRKGKTPPKLTGRVISTLVALVVLVVVLRYLPPGRRSSEVQAARTPVAVAPEDVQLGNLQLSLAPGAEALYIDGVLTNAGHGAITGATMQVDLLDARGNLVTSVQKPIVSMAHGGTDLIKNEFARNPITPNEMRFFRVAVDQVPHTWNHEVPSVKVVAVTSR